MNLDGPATSRTSRTRPKDRRGQILTQASLLFYQDGFGNVTMADIARAVGISAGGLYRHFGSKDELLIEAMSAILRRADGICKSAEGDADRILSGLTDLSFEFPGGSLFWQRDRHHLPMAQQKVFLNRTRQITEHLAEQLDRHGAPPDQNLRMWAIWGLVSSVGRHQATVDRARLRMLIIGSAERLLAVPYEPAALTRVGGATEPAPGVRLDLQRVSRREALLTAAATLFERYGYAQVSMSDLGAAIGVTGPNVYSYVDSKDELLLATVMRGYEAMQLEFSHILRVAPSPDEALQRVVTAFVDVSLQMPFASEGILINLPDLPDGKRDGLRQMAQDQVSEWAWLLRQTRPDLNDLDARILSQGAVTMVSSAVRNWRLRTQPGTAAELTRLAAAILATPTPV